MHRSIQDDPRVPNMIWAAFLVCAGGLWTHRFGRTASRQTTGLRVAVVGTVGAWAAFIAMVWV